MNIYLKRLGTAQQIIKPECSLVGGSLNGKDIDA